MENLIEITYSVGSSLYSHQSFLQGQLTSKVKSVEEDIKNLTYNIVAKAVLRDVYHKMIRGEIKDNTVTYDSRFNFTDEFVTFESARSNGCYRCITCSKCTTCSTQEKPQRVWDFKGALAETIISVFADAGLKIIVSVENRRSIQPAFPRFWRSLITFIE